METGIWKQIEERLAEFFGQICLNADGYKLDLIRERCKNRLVIAIYVNGVMRGAWMQYLKKGETPCEEARRFFQPLTKSLIPRTKLDKMRHADKKWCDSLIYTFYRAWWSDAKPLIRHLKKTCKSVTLWQEPETNVPVGETKSIDSETKSSVAETKKTRV